MKLYNLILSFILSFFVMFSASQYFMMEMLMFMWISIMLWNYSKSKNNFISMLLTLEVLSLIALFMSSIYVMMNGILVIMFILMTLSVGEAVLGLAILVKLARWNSTEFLLSGLN